MPFLTPRAPATGCGARSNIASTPMPISAPSPVAGNGPDDYRACTVSVCSVTPAQEIVDGLRSFTPEPREQKPGDAAERLRR